MCSNWIYQAIFPKKNKIEKEAENLQKVVDQTRKKSIADAHDIEDELRILKNDEYYKQIIEFNPNEYLKKPEKRN